MAVRIDVVTTRGGDRGATGLGDGTRVAKDAARIEAIGAVDEANAALGVLAAEMLPGASRAFVQRLQHALFDIGGDLCFPQPGGSGERGMRVGTGLTETIEAQMHVLLERQAPLTSFVLPGGSRAAAAAHVARTAMRRAERRVVSLAGAEPVNPALLPLLNRLSDYLFVLARHLNADGTADILWQRL